MLLGTDLIFELSTNSSVSSDFFFFFFEIKLLFRFLILHSLNYKCTVTTFKIRFCVSYLF